MTELGAVDAQGRITPVGNKLRQLPLPPRLARMVVDAAATGEALLAADIAVVLTERGLGGNDVDLTHRLDGLRRDRSPRASEARAMAKRWAEMTRANATLSPDPPGPGWSCGALLGLAYPDRIAKNRGGKPASCSPMAAAPGSMPDRRLRARRSWRSPRSPAPPRRAASCWRRPSTLAEIEAGQAGRIETREEIVFDAAAASLRARRIRRLDALTLNEQPMTVVPSAESARTWRRASPGSGSSGCRGPRRCGNGATA